MLRTVELRFSSRRLSSGTEILIKKTFFFFSSMTSRALFTVYMHLLFLERKSEVGVSALSKITIVTVRTHYNLNE